MDEGRGRIFCEKERQWPLCCALSILSVVTVPEDCPIEKGGNGGKQERGTFCQLGSQEGRRRTGSKSVSCSWLYVLHSRVEAKKEASEEKRRVGALVPFHGLGCLLSASRLLSLVPSLKRVPGAKSQQEVSHQDLVGSTMSFLPTLEQQLGFLQRRDILLRRSGDERVTVLRAGQVLGHETQGSARGFAVGD